MRRVCGGYNDMVRKRGSGKGRNRDRGKSRGRGRNCGGYSRGKQ